MRMTQRDSFGFSGREILLPRLVGLRYPPEQSGEPDRNLLVIHLLGFSGLICCQCFPTQCRKGLQLE